jgi:hypothetical protein
MRWICGVALVAITSAGAANGQILWTGLAGGRSWEWQAQTASNQDWQYNNSLASAAFVAFVIDEGTLLRFRAADVPHDVAIDGVGFPGRLRAYTVGVDYLLPGVFGNALFSLGFGSYRQYLAARRPPAGYDQAKLGWYGGVGEWFPLTRRTRVTAEITMHRTPHQGGTTVVTATAGLALNFY